MGLLKGVGRELKGLLQAGGLADTVAEARAWLDGDYETAMRLSERDADRRRALRAQRRAAEEAARRARAMGHETAHITAMIDDPDRGRIVLRNGEWLPWEW
jgi:hypothetical protein